MPRYERIDTSGLAPFFADEVFLEIGDDWWELRRAERFRDGTWAFADREIWSGCMPAEGPIQRSAEMDPRWHLSTVEEFEAAWTKARRSEPPRLSRYYGITRAGTAEEVFCPDWQPADAIWPMARVGAWVLATPAGRVEIEQTEWPPPVADPAAQTD
ncbi:hypothetical protein [Prosthecodimorpha staleyi]|uniref:Uncharacterized protein n=1 Tax=Prosthecodimorpha staleyi TaxID=2840188 RepID=A0A947D7C6_9HYPH|nr:hypothetical protein [Prosthecodimorpha staleyi]MBT9289432.1 hypothetical protein [Prosthecodimorpha staleyi]